VINPLYLREYFAAHAPAEIPKWFPWPSDVPLPDDKEAIEFAREDPRWTALAMADRRRVVRVLEGGGAGEKPGSETINAIADEALAKYREYDRHRTAAANERIRVRYIRWRWTYADMMLAGRS
jgi:hypothetical protein